MQAYSLFGIYSTKYQRLLTLAVLFAAPLVTATIPSLSAAIARKDYKSYLRQVREGFRLNFIVVLPLATALSFLSQPILTVIFASQNQGAMLVSIGVWTSLLTTVQTLQNGILISLNKPLIPPLALLTGMVAKAACNYLLIPIPALNIYGALIGNVCAWLISISINQYCIRRLLGRKLRVARYSILPVCGAVMMGARESGLFHGAAPCVRDFYLPPRACQRPFYAADHPLRRGGLLHPHLQAGHHHPGDVERMPLSKFILAASRRIPFVKLEDAPAPAEKAPGGLNAAARPPGRIAPDQRMRWRYYA